MGRLWGRCPAAWGVVADSEGNSATIRHNPLSRAAAAAQLALPSRPLTFADTKRNVRRDAQPPAISSSVVTVVQLRAVAVTPSPLPASAFHSLERATPSGCQA